MKKQNVFIISVSFFIATVLLSLGASFLAWDPSELLAPYEEAPQPISVQMAEPAQKEEIQEPAPNNKEASLLSTLAPDSFAGPQDLKAGVAFGSGGFGPAVGGGGGFGSEAASLVREGAAINRPPRVVLKGSLDYPTEARQRSVSGFVHLKILVTATGSVENVQVLESEPRGYFEQAAMKSIKTWKFEPAMVKGQIVAAWTSQKIKFELN